jgi:hypothetical protein
MIKFLDVGYLISCRHKIKREDKLVVTSCVLKVIRHKIKKGLHLFLEKFEIIRRDFVKKYYSIWSGKRRRRSPKEIAEEMAQRLELKGYADVAFLFRAIARYYIKDLYGRGAPLGLYGERLESPQLCGRLGTGEPLAGALGWFIP